MRLCLTTQSARPEARSQARSPQGVLGAGEDHDVVATVGRAGEPLGIGREEAEIGEVRDVRQADDGDTKIVACGGLGVLDADAVLGIELDLGSHRKDAEAGAAGAFLEDADAGSEEAGVAAEAVHGEGAEEGALGVVEQVVGADDGGEDAAAVDVGDKESGGVEAAGEAEVARGRDSSG